MMKRKTRSFKRVLLIVCEGTATEPQYLGWLKDNISIPNEIWGNIEIFDDKTMPNDIPIAKIPELGKKRPKRQFQNPNKRDKAIEINALEEILLILRGEEKGLKEYEEVKAHPLRFVALAQYHDELSKGTYDELWAIFDKDGHPKHQEAFALAQQPTNGKIVNIAFSSRSFEQWILLHFEQSNRVFQQTTCKDEKKKVIDCSQNQGCEGEICLVGYLKTNYLPNYAKSSKFEDLDEMMQQLKKKQEIAFQNAASLRKEKQEELIKNGNKVYELNPYTDVDILVKRLIE